MLSIIIPTHNRLGMLKDLLGSIKKQTFRNFEVIIVADNCSDGTNEYLLSANFPQMWRYVISEIPLNAGKSRKRGFVDSKGEYVTFVDDDDYLTDDDYYARVIHLFEEYPRLSVVAANSLNKYEDTAVFENVYVNIEGYIRGLEYMSGFQFKWCKPNPSFAVFRRSKLLEADIDNIQMVNDCPLYMRALLVGDIYIEKEPVGVYRLHGKNISKSIGADFLIDNLEEKDYIYYQLKRMKVSFSLSYWWYRTVRLTFDYFMNSHPSRTEVYKVTKWCNKHTHCSIRLALYLRLVIFEKVYNVS